MSSGGACRIIKFPVSSPADNTPLAKLKELGYSADDVIAVLGKSEGNGCVNDFSRTLSQMVWDNATPKAVSVFSGGTEGVLTPHVSFVVKESKPTGLLCAVGHTRLFLPEEIGSPTQSEEVCKTVKEMMKSSNLTADDVKLALIKCPLLTSAKMEDIRVRGKTACSKDTYESMGSSRYATAIGIAAALDEIKPSEIPASLSRTDVWSSKASCSSGAELDDCHVFLLATPSYGSAPASSGSLRAVSGYMRDAIDAKAIIELLDKVKADKGKVVQAFVKAEASPDGLIRGQRHTMTTDSDIHSTRHARAAVGGLLAGLTGDTCIYVSGGAEGQGPPGGGSLCIVYEI